ncbi:hypothetical protein EXIGLDRAFT_693240 [Exidia glandulosa HHB12029]|uniref:Uncharacterized protein n=1 Tax=Exidia glandulosa HHB12029 TaxID=1314781 RepID=A0A165HGB3_EXIGL|nr:hypothetical protein EXIGLDRAFT_693240 [Exidia glandulosa HHB12029]
MSTLRANPARRSCSSTADHPGNTSATNEHVRDMLPLFARLKTDVRATGPSWHWQNFLASGFVINSRARLDTYDLDWGTTIGKSSKRCDRIRHPRDCMSSVAAPKLIVAHGCED